MVTYFGRKPLRKLGEIPFFGQGEIRQMPMLSVGDISSDNIPDSGNPVIIHVINQGNYRPGELYRLAFVQSSYDTQLNKKRAECIEEIIMAITLGAKLIVNGVKIRQQLDEYELEDAIPDDPNIYKGTIHLVLGKRVKEYLFCIDGARNHDGTKLEKVIDGWIN